MQEVFESIQELEKIRNIPQFIFLAPIKHFPALRVREAILKFSKKHSDVKEIDFILVSLGGSADSAYMIIKTLREHFATVNIIIPFWAKSAATLLALGGSTIIMDEFGEFGPLDVQISRDDELPDSDPQSGLIDEYSLMTIENRATALYQRMMKKLLMKNKKSREIDIRLKKTNLSEQTFNYISNLYGPLFGKIDPYQIGEKARSLAIAERYAERILNQYNKENMKSEIDYFIDYIVHECPDHGYSIDHSIISRFLSNVKKSKEISEEYYQALTALSLIIVNDPSEYFENSFIGFFDKKLLAKEKKEEDNKKDNYSNKATVLKKEERKEEKTDEKTETTR
jgi:hypothetical protein